jgi:hypothetical protein
LTHGNPANIAVRETTAKKRLHREAMSKFTDNSRVFGLNAVHLAFFRKNFDTFFNIFKM